MDDILQDDGFSEDEDVIRFDECIGYSNNMEQDDDDRMEVEESTTGLLHPVIKLQNLTESSHIFDRQLAAQNILDVLREVAYDDDDVQTVVSIMFRLSDDPDTLVRAEIVDQVPHIAAFCSEHTRDLKSVIRQQLIPLTVKHLSDPENKVLQAGQSSLLGLLERGLIDKAQLCEWICPLAAQQAGSAADCVKMDAVTLICKMAPLIEKEIAVKFFLEQFASLCLDSTIGVRQICSANFGKFCKVAGTEVTENTLLSRFLSLCGDDTWVIRKSCAEVFVDICDVVCESTRKEILPNIFLGLLCDNSRPVRTSAYQSLGAVITTFADPKKSGVVHCADGSFITVPIDNDMSNFIPESHISNFIVYGQSNVEMDTSESVVNEKICTGETTSLANRNTPKTSNIMNAANDWFHLKAFSTSETVLNTDNMKHVINNYDFDHANKCSTDSLENLIPENVLSLEISILKSQSNDSDKENINHEILLPGTDSEIAAGDQIFSNKVDDATPACKQLCSTSVNETSTNVSHQSSIDSTDTKSPLAAAQKNGHHNLHLKENGFNNFQYWRLPLPDTELDVIDIGNGRAVNVNYEAKPNGKTNQNYSSATANVEVIFSNPAKEGGCSKYSAQHIQELQIHMAFDTVGDHTNVETGSGISSSRTINVNSPCSEAICSKDATEAKQKQDEFCIATQENCLHLLYQQTPFNSSNKSNEKSPYEQDIVPPQLLERYIGMVIPDVTLSVDEMTRKCAYSFPAVAYTLGKHNWSCIRNVCNILAKDIQWKVRKTVAASLHELGMILGCKITARDLLPLSLSFIKDVDEVKMGVLLHLEEFLKILDPPERREFLPYIAEFIKMDNQNIWRYRHMLALQMGPMTDLFTPSDILEHFVPVAMWLIRDRVSEVRQTAVKLIAVILRRLTENEEPSVTLCLLMELTEKFREAQKWLWRQTYAFLCQQITVAKALPCEMFVENIASHFLTLTWDIVPNVRLVVARCLAQTLLPSSYFSSIKNAHYQLLLRVIRSLESDDDSDVSYFGRIAAEAFSVFLDEKDIDSINMGILP